MDAASQGQTTGPDSGIPAPGISVTVARDVVPNATLVERHDLTGSVARFLVRADGAAPIVEPGQYLALGLSMERRLLQRPYSAAKVGEAIEFLIRLVPGGVLTPRLWSLDVGARVHLGRPKGRLRLQPGEDRSHLFLATGTGLAPFVAMLDSLLARDPGARAVVVHGVSYEAELAYRDVLVDRSATHPGIAYVPVVSRAGETRDAPWSGRIGRIDGVLDEVWYKHALRAGATVAYLCGNPEMVRTVTRHLLGRGLAAEEVRSETFWSASGG